jgi:hypothetical protein
MTHKIYSIGKKMRYKKSKKSKENKTQNKIEK